MGKAVGACYGCGYPLAAEVTGETVTCPNCNTPNIAAVSENARRAMWQAAAGAVGIVIGFTLLKKFGLR